jgi:hypothetical protein
LSATVARLLGHPRLHVLRLDATPDAIWAGLARHGRPIQHVHIREPLALWDVWRPIAGPPVALEPPSAGFALSWRALADDATLGRAYSELHAHAYRSHEFGDSVLIERSAVCRPAQAQESYQRGRDRGEAFSPHLSAPQHPPPFAPSRLDTLPALFIIRRSHVEPFFLFSVLP